MYKIYFYSEPSFLYIDSESILDLDLKMTADKKIFEMKYNDFFFNYNLKASKKKSWSIIIQSYDSEGKFVLQSNFFGENMKTQKKKDSNFIRFQYEQISNNKIWNSLPPIFEQGEEEYIKGKLSYIRNLKLENILNQK